MRLFIYEFICAGGLGPDTPQSLRREGWAMLSAVAADFAQLADVQVTTLVDATCPQPAGQECRRVAGAEADRFRECAARADATLVIAPEFDDCLRQRSAWVAEAGGRLLGSLPAAVALTADKLTLAAHWHARGVRTPPTLLAGRESPTAFLPPWVCKPRHGAGSQATVFVSDAAAWPTRYRQADAEWAGRDLIAQPFVPGAAASMAWLVGRDCCVPLRPGSQRRLSCAGRFHYRGGQLPLPPPLAARAVALGRATLAGIPGLQGYVGVDLVLGAAGDGSEDYAIEINARLTTSYIGLRRLCRSNLARAWLDVVDGRAVAPTWEDATVWFDADGKASAGPSEPAA